METLKTQCTLSNNVLFQNSKYSIETWFNQNINKECIVLVRDQLFTDWPILDYNNNVVYDNPLSYPKYIKQLVKKYYLKLNK